jgi:ferric iron reductase protein FhuF
VSLPPEIPFLPGWVLTDPAWLADRVDDAGRAWGRADRGVLTTLWWYSASLVLLGPSVHALVTTGAGAACDPPSLTLTLTPTGNLERVLPGAALEAGPEAFGAHLGTALAPVVAALADVGRVPPQRLRALLADSLGNRLVAERRTDLAPAIAAGTDLLRPVPRFTRVTPEPTRPDVHQTYLRRASCCLIFRIPGQGLCVSCPRQDPAERAERLDLHTRSRFGLV